MAEDNNWKFVERLCVIVGTVAAVGAFAFEALDYFKAPEAGAKAAPASHASITAPLWVVIVLVLFAIMLLATGWAMMIERRRRERREVTPRGGAHALRAVQENAKLWGGDGPLSPAKRPPLLTDFYDSKDRQRIRDAMRELLARLDDLGDKCNEIQRLASSVTHVSNGSESQAVVSRISEIREHLAHVRELLGSTFIHGRDDGNEVWDVLGDRDPINVMLISLAEYISAVENAPKNPTPELANIFNRSYQKLQDDNLIFGAWIDEGRKRVRAKREALGPD